MKKIISILLSVMMLAGCFVAMIPTASAKNENIANGSVVPSVTKGELLYSEDFEGANIYDAEETVLSGNDLIASLGWSGSVSGKNTISVVESDENHAVILKAYMSDYALTFLNNEKLAGGDYIVEYTQTLRNNEKNHDNKFGVVTGGNASKNSGSDTVVSAMVQEQGASGISVGVPGMKLDDMTAEFHDFERTGRASYKSEAGSTKSRVSGTTYNKTFHFRFVLDSQFGASMYVQKDGETDWTLISYANMAAEIGAVNWQKNATAIRSDVAFSILEGLAIELDNIKVYEIERQGGETVPGFVGKMAPSLIVSEVMAQGGEGHAWLEVYNASATTLNVYDYAIAREAGVAVNNMYSGTVAADEVAYILPGNGNPEYAGGALLPGQAAILFVPTSATATVETFKANDLIGTYGMTADDVAALKIFTIDFDLGTNTNDLLAVTPVVEGVAKAIDHNITEHDYVVSLTADFKAGKDAYVAFDGVGSAGYVPAQYLSYEVAFIEGNEYVGYGLEQTALTPAKKTLDGTPCTPGYLPLNITKKLQSVILTGMILEEDVTDQLYLATELVPSVVPADTVTKKFVGWRDSAGNVIQTLAPVYELGEDIVLTAVYDTEIPELAGYQKTAVEGGKYDLRIVAYVDRLDSVAFGMKIDFKYNNGRQDVIGSNVYYCRYVYEEISDNYGQGTVAPETYDAKYLVVFHIEDCPANIAVEYTVTTFVAFEDEGGGRTTEWNPDSMTFAIAA